MGNSQKRNAEQRKSTSSLEEVFGNSLDLDLLKKYLISVYSIEYMLFIERYFSYLNEFDKKGNTYEKLVSYAKDLEYTFISPESPFCLNLPDKISSRVSTEIDKILNKRKKSHSRNKAVFNFKEVRESKSLKQIYPNLYTLFNPVYYEVMLILKNSHSSGYNSYIELYKKSMTSISTSLPSVSELMRIQHEASYASFFDDYDEIYVV